MAAVHEALRSVRVADVYKKSVRVARLRREPDAVIFEYLDEHLAADGRPVATTLPLSATPICTQAGAVPAFFAGLLPEGRRLTSLRRAVKTSADDELSLLLAVGRDTVGDVQVVPEGESAASAEPRVQVKSSWAEIRFSELLADAGIIDPVALPGVQDKVSARMITLPVARAHERYILKLDPPESPHLIENEAFFLKLAHEARLPVVKAEVVRDADGRAALLVRRFDRVRASGSAVTSLACEDGCQVLGRWPADKYNVSAEEVVNGLTSRCAARAVAAHAFFRQLCFGWLTGNGDLHAKNLSILEGAEAEWMASPAYDLPATAPYGDDSLALSVQGRTRGLSRRHWLSFADAIGLPTRSAETALDDVLERTKGLAERLRGGVLPFPQKATADWIAELRNRRSQA